jgi:DNA-binding transcriptional regulator YdaS (Cro superfamily)
MDLKTYLYGLPPDERDDYAERAGTTVAYLIQLAGNHRKASPGLAKALAAASGNKVKLSALRPDIWSDRRAS